jgi:hypothetical protein
VGFDEPVLSPALPTPWIWLSGLPGERFALDRSDVASAMAGEQGTEAVIARD